MNQRTVWMLVLNGALVAEVSAQQFVYPAKGQSPAAGGQPSNSRRPLPRRAPRASRAAVTRSGDACTPRLSSGGRCVEPAQGIGIVLSGRVGDEPRPGSDECNSPHGEELGPESMRPLFQTGFDMAAKGNPLAGMAGPPGHRRNRVSRISMLCPNPEFPPC